MSRNSSEVASDVESVGISTLSKLCIMLSMVLQPTRVMKVRVIARSLKCFMVKVLRRK